MLAWERRVALFRRLLVDRAAAPPLPDVAGRKFGLLVAILGLACAPASGGGDSPRPVTPDSAGGSGGGPAAPGPSVGGSGGAGVTTASGGASGGTTAPVPNTGGAPAPPAADAAPADPDPVPPDAAPAVPPVEPSTLVCNLLLGIKQTGEWFDAGFETLVIPGHGPETTIGLEREDNPFVGKHAR